MQRAGTAHPERKTIEHYLMEGACKHRRHHSWTAHQVADVLWPAEDAPVNDDTLPASMATNVRITT